MADSAPHLFLIGYRGTGKTTVGRLLSQKLNRRFDDTDANIESSAGKTIREIFEEEGESGFRDREQVALSECAARELPTVVSLGGGAILREQNRQLLRQRGRCIWLTGSPECLFHRIAGDAASERQRPNLSDRGGYDEVVEMLTAREPLYSALAQLTIITDDRKPEDIVNEIVDWVN